MANATDSLAALRSGASGERRILHWNEDLAPASLNARRTQISLRHKKVSKRCQSMVLTYAPPRGHWGMTLKPRLEYPCAIYPVVNPGRREACFKDDRRCTDSVKSA